MESREVRMHIVLHVGGTVAVVQNADGTFGVGEILGPSLQVSAASLNAGPDGLNEQEQKGYVGAALFHIVQELVLKRLAFGRVEDAVKFTQPGGVA